MRFVRRVLKLAAAALTLATYVWFAAVRAVPAVKRRKAERRAAAATARARQRSAPPATPE